MGCRREPSRALASAERPLLTPQACLPVASTSCLSYKPQLLLSLWPAPLILHPSTQPDQSCPRETNPTQCNPAGHFLEPALTWEAEREGPRPSSASTSLHLYDLVAFHFRVSEELTCMNARRCSQESVLSGCPHGVYSVSTSLICLKKRITLPPREQ